MVKTVNKFGKINISDYAIAMVANHAALECYGVADLVSRRFTDSVIELFNKVPNTKGIRIDTVDNKINVEVYALLKDGVNINAVKDSVESAVKYHIEDFTGMRVGSVAVRVLGVRV